MTRFVMKMVNIHAMFFTCFVQYNLKFTFDLIFKELESRVYMYMTWIVLV